MARPMLLFRPRSTRHVRINHLTLAPLRLHEDLPSLSHEVRL